MKKISMLALVIFVLAGISFAQGKNVDNFELGTSKIAVFFYDPILRFAKADKDFESSSDKEKSAALDKYLHENPLYLFRLTDKKTGDIRYLCIRGNPAKVNTKMFYKVEVIKGVGADFDPTTTDYADKIIRVIDEVNCGGTLFENMAIFDNQKTVVGNGIQVYGYYSRVQPYSEIKASIIKIIEKLGDK